MITAYANFRHGLNENFQRIALRDGAELVEIRHYNDHGSVVFIPYQGITTMRVVCCGPEADQPGGKYWNDYDTCTSAGPLNTNCDQPSGHRGVHAGVHPELGFLKW